MKSIVAFGVTIARDSPSAGCGCMASLACARFNSYTLGGTVGFCAGSCVKTSSHAVKIRMSGATTAQARRVFTR